MSKRSKLEKFAENLNLPNVFENFSFNEPALFKSLQEKVDFRGSWKSVYFKNEFPLVLELACGRGEYCLGLSALFPERNYLGIDIKGARIWKGAKKALELKNNQIAFIRSKIELLHYYFAPKEVDEIWITFPDPFLKKSRAGKRLTAPFYLSIYKQILRPGAILHLKTDDDTLYQYSLEIIKQDPDFNIEVSSLDIYTDNYEDSGLMVKTYYEEKHLAIGKKIKYIKFRFSKFQ